MRLAYLDETYTKSRFCIVALVIPSDEARALEDRLDAVVERTPDVDRHAELHGYCLDDGSDDWAPLKDKPQARATAYRRAVAALCETNGLYLIVGGVNLDKVDWNTQTNDPHEWALRFVVEKIHREFPGESILTICDDVNQREKYRRAFAEFKRNGTGGGAPCDLRGFVDGLHFAPSHHSRLVQAADLAAYVYRRVSISVPANVKGAAFYSELWGKLTETATQRYRLWPL